jgi:hypothetical protein
VLQVARPGEQLEEIADLLNPEGRLQGSARDLQAYFAGKA